MANLPLLGTLGLTLTTLATLAVTLASGCGSSVNGSGGSAGGGGSAGAAACGELVKNETGSPVDVRLVNHTSADIFVHGGSGGAACGGLRPFIVKDQNGDEVALRPPGSCEATCESGSCICTITYTCLPTPIVRIVPEGSVTMKWNGLVVESRDVPTSCVGSADCKSSGETTTCSALIAPEVALSFIGSAWPAVTCGTGTCSTCTPDAKGSCQVDEFSNVSGDVVQATGTWSPGAGTLDIVFGP